MTLLDFLMVSDNENVMAIIKNNKVHVKAKPKFLSLFCGNLVLSEIDSILLFDGELYIKLK